MKLNIGKFVEGSSSIPRLTKEMSNHSVSEVFGSFIEYLKKTKQASEMEPSLWNDILDLESGIEDFEYSQREDY